MVIISGFFLSAFLPPQFSVWQYATWGGLALVILLGVNWLVFRYLDDGGEAEEVEAGPARTMVGTPRARRIQPVENGLGVGALTASGPSPFSETVADIPADSLAATLGSAPSSRGGEPSRPSRQMPLEPIPSTAPEVLPAFAKTTEPVPAVRKEEAILPIPAPVPAFGLDKKETPAEPLKVPMSPLPVDLPKVPEPVMAKAPEPPADLIQVPALSKAPVPPADLIQVPALSKAPEIAPVAEVPKAAEPSKILPPMMLPELPKAPEVVPAAAATTVPATLPSIETPRAPEGALVSVTPKPAELPKAPEAPVAEEPLVLPSLPPPAPVTRTPSADLIPEAKPVAEPVSTRSRLFSFFKSSEENPAAAPAGVPATASAAKTDEMQPVGTAPTVEKTGAGLPVIGQVVPPTASTGTGADLIDVKKAATLTTDDESKGPTAGLILHPIASGGSAETARPAVPSATETAKPADVRDQAPLSPATPPAAATPAEVEKPKEDAGKEARPRIFMPSNLPVDSTPAARSEPIPPAPSLPIPAAAEAVPETPAALAPNALVAPTAATAPVAKEIPSAAPVPVTVPLPTPIEPPVEKAPETTKPVPEPTSAPSLTTAMPAESKPVEKKVELPPLPTPAPTPVVGNAIPPEDGTPAAPLVEPPATALTLIPAAAPAPPASKPGEFAPAGSLIAPVPSVPASVPQPVSVSKPAPTMATTETTTNMPANARAAAQLTLGFEITSLQLTPFFKLGAVQLRPLSNIVSLHLIASQATDNPLAAGISFQIVTVDLDGDSHIKSLLLKPLPNAQQAAVPSPKLQVDAVNITSAGEGAPITISSSDQTSTAVQLLANFTIAAMDFTPSFEIGSLRLEPTSNSVLLRLAPSQRPAALDLPPSFEVASVQLGGDAQISGMRLTPGTAALKGA